jgi:cupin 2 domain-containing protein
MDNLFHNLPVKLSEELVTSLSNNKNVRIERIVSSGHASPTGYWYDQEEHEWVVVLKGKARILFEGDDRPIEMKAGDHITIPAHSKHRLEWTIPDEPTVWLAVFYRD